jgi:hypothetical protein
MTNKEICKDFWNSLVNKTDFDTSILPERFQRSLSLYYNIIELNTHYVNSGLAAEHQMQLNKLHKDFQNKKITNDVYQQKRLDCFDKDIHNRFEVFFQVALEQFPATDLTIKYSKYILEPAKIPSDIDFEEVLDSTWALYLFRGLLSDNKIRCNPELVSTWDAFATSFREAILAA